MDHFVQKKRTPKHAAIVDPYHSHHQTYHNIPPPRPFPAPAPSLRGASPLSSLELLHSSRHAQHISKPTSPPILQHKETHRLDYLTQPPTLKASSTNTQRLNPTQRQLPSDNAHFS